MIVQCGHCGAPLDVKESATTTKCRYCRTVNERQRMRTIESTTPRDFRPPKLWIPPPEFTAVAGKPLQPWDRSAVPIAVAAISIPLLLVALGVVFAIKSKPSARYSMGVSGDVLASVNIAQPPNGLASALGGNASEANVRVRINEPRFESISFGYEKTELSHPNSFFFQAIDEQKPDPRIVEALSAKLSRPLVDGSFNGSCGFNLNVHKDLGSISVHVNPVNPVIDAPNERWKRQMAVLYKLVVGVIFNKPFEPTRDEKLELLCAPHPFGSLATLDPSTPVESAPSTITKRFLGSVAGSPHGGVKIWISVDHPLLFEAQLTWKNEKGGVMTGAYFRETPLFASKREALVGCLGQKLGAPETRDTDYVKKKKEYEFRAGKSSVYIGETSFSVGGQGNRIAPADWAKIISAVDGCR